MFAALAAPGKSSPSTEGMAVAQWRTGQLAAGLVAVVLPMFGKGVRLRPSSRRRDWGLIQ
jgi:hypothetical protein